MVAGVGLYGWVWEKTGDRGRKWLEWGLAALIAVVSAASVATHEPWADESHAWLLARDLSVGELWREMAYEGHLLPWHLILHPFAGSGAPMAAMGWISWLINAATVAWFARQAPLGGLAKAAVGLSCVFLYVNPVVSRCYVLVPAVLFGLAALWGKRDERPMAFGVTVALLANTHLNMEGAVVAVFLMYAWENILRRRDGKGWRECRRQWAGLGTMAAGGMLALAQVLPSVWKSSLSRGNHFGWQQDAMWFFRWCEPPPAAWAVAAGLAWLGVEAWRRDKGVFWVYAGSLAYMVGFSVFLYPAHIINRSLLWWPVAIWAAWILAGSGKVGRCGRIGMTAAMAAMGLGLLRPDLTLGDWQRPYDPLPGACLFVAEQYGRDAEVWINGSDFWMETARLHLDNLKDWQTGEPPERICWIAGRERSARLFRFCREEIFWQYPEKEEFLAMGQMAAGLGFAPDDVARSGVKVEWVGQDKVCPDGYGILLIRVRKGGAEERGMFWAETGMARLSRGDREGAFEALERAARVDTGQWEAMNNLAWLCVEDGEIADARAWMDQAMEHEAAQESAGVWDTEAAVRRAEGNEEGAREAERRRDELKVE